MFSDCKINWLVRATDSVQRMEFNRRGKNITLFALPGSADVKCRIEQRAYFETTAGAIGTQSIGISATNLILLRNAAAYIFLQRGKL